MKELLDRMREVINNDPNVGNVPNDCLESLAYIVRLHDAPANTRINYSIRADERERLYSLIVKTVPATVVRLYLSDVIKAIKAE